MGTVWNDLRYAIRGLMKSPGFALVAVFTLALGVGANAAVFSLISAVMLRPLPYAAPERLVTVWESAPFFGLRDSPVAPANYADWRARSRSFEEMGAIEDHVFRLVGDGNPEVVNGSSVTAGLWRALRTRPAMGRLFRDEEDRPGAAKVAVISDSLWRRRFNSDPAIIGKTFQSDEKYTIVGVLAPGTEPPAEYHAAPGELWSPIGSEYTPDGLANRGRHNWMVIARLRPGVRIEGANAEMQAIGASLSREYPATNEKVGAFVAPLREHFVTSSRLIFTVLLGTVAFVLLIACSNLANLLLSRAANRTKEVALRSALGAGIWQLARQFLCESLLLSSAGSALGLLLATTTFQFLGHLAPGTVSGFKDLAIDSRVLGFTLALAVLTTVVFGLVPLLQIRRLGLNSSLKQNARTLATVTGSRRLRALLVSAEVALAFVLLIGAGLLIQTFARLRGVDPGFRTKNVLTLRIPPSEKVRGPGKSTAYQREILSRVRAIPGVVSAGFTNHVPLVFKGDISGVGGEGRPEKERIQCNNRMAGPGFLETMGIPVVSGRDIEERDADGAPYVVLVNQTLAQKLWPGQDPLGRRVIFGTNVTVPVVGVVRDIHTSLDAPPKPEFYVSTLQAGSQVDSLVIRTKVDAGSLAGPVRQAIWAVDPDQPITGVATMEEILDKEVFQRRVQTMLLTAFAGLALLLAAIGLYGVLAYQVGRQVPEIGVRMALGAAPSDILGKVVGHGLRLTAAGLAAGAVGALALSRLLTTVLYGVKPTDPATYAIVAAVLFVTATLASYLPARRAMRVDPLSALREE